jgi:hypothetical protein
MLRRMWRAFWTAMREPVRRYAPTSELQIRVTVDADDAVATLKVLAEKAARLRAETDAMKWLH